MANSILRIVANAYPLLDYMPVVAKRRWRVNNENETISIDLLNTESGFLLSQWAPGIAPFKGGGSWQSSPLSDGRRMVLRNFDNAIETFEFKCRGAGMDIVIDYMQKLTGLLEMALAYWTTDWQKAPVWLEARGAGETNIRYALIKNYSIEGLSNPYSQPFFAFCRSLTATDLTLMIERDHWMDVPPGESTCVEANTLQEFDNAAQRVERNISVSASADDIYVDQGAQAGFDGTTRLYVGVFPNDDIPAEVGLRFQNVTVPYGAIIKRAYLTVVISASGSDDDNDLDFVIMGEDVDSAAAWTDADINGITGANLYTNYISRKNQHHTDAVAVIRSAADSWHTDALSTNINGLEAVIQEIVNRSGWVSGNDLALFIDYRLPEGWTGPDDSRAFYSQDDLVNTEPILNIEYVEGYATEDGREDTCVGNSYIANKHVKAQITNIYNHYDTDADDTPDTYSGNLVGAPLPYSMPQAVPCENDEILFGIATSVHDLAGFDSLVLDLYTATAFMDATWYYRTAGPAWTELATIRGNKQLDIPGESIVFWSQPSDWIKTTENGVEGYWVKVVFTNVGVGGAAVAAVQQNRDIYTSITPFLDIDGDEVPGELAAKARIHLFGTDTIAPPGLVVAALRSKSRGSNFSPYLNFSPINNPPDVTFFYNVAETTLNLDSSTPSGYDISVATSAIADYTNIAGFSLSSEMAIQYRGRYRAYLRYRQSGGVAGDIRVRIGYRTARNIEIFTEGVFTTHVTDYPIVLDLGVIEFGTDYRLTPDDYVEWETLRLYQEELVATAITMYYYDLILMPADECIGIYYTAGTDWYERLVEGNYLDIDNIGNPRAPRAIMRKHTDAYATGNMVRAEWEHQTREGIIFQANSDQRLWFLTAQRSYLYSPFRSKIYGKLYRASRYLSMRGDS